MFGSYDNSKYCEKVFVVVVVFLLQVLEIAIFVIRISSIGTSTLRYKKSGQQFRKSGMVFLTV